MNLERSAETDDGLLIAVDVGSRSARAAVFRTDGVALAHCSHPIQLWRPLPDFFEQSSEDIWSSVEVAVEMALQEAEERAAIERASVRAVGFDATCSLVVLDEGGNPVSISAENTVESGFTRDVIAWMDHRAVEQAERLNQTKDPCLADVGGSVSPEMQIPKLAWIKERHPDAWRSAGLFLDLADYLVHRATGSEEVDRSVCTTTCKWFFHPEDRVPGATDPSAGWRRSVWDAAGLGEIADESFHRVGEAHRIRPVGAAASRGLASDVARKWNVTAGVPVAMGLIDAHAGMLGSLGASSSADDDAMAIIAGTSACHMRLTLERCPVRGVWGPYAEAVLPGRWLLEAGQSAAGAFVDHAVRSHAAFSSEELARKVPMLSEGARESGAVTGALYDWLNEEVAAWEATEGWHSVLSATGQLHLLPDIWANRSPMADPRMRGSIVGESDGTDIRSLVARYVSALLALCYGTRHILDAERSVLGRLPRRLVLSGGLSSNPLFRRLLQEVTRVRVRLVAQRGPMAVDAVLQGSAVAAFAAASDQAGEISPLTNAMQVMTHFCPSECWKGDDDAWCFSFHEAKYQVFRRMLQDQQEYRALMDGVLRD